MGAGSSAGPATEGGLRRGIGFGGLVAMSIGVNIGGGLFALVNLAGAQTGPSLPLAMLIAATPALLALVPYRVLARGYPTTSATYRYAKLRSPALAFTVLTGLAVAIVVAGLPLFARVAGDYLAALLPAPPLAIALASLVAFYLINVLGVRLTVRVQAALLAGLLAALALYIVLGAGAVQTAHIDGLLPEGVGGLLAASGMLYALMAGGLFIIDVGGEVVDPSRVYGRALTLGMLIVLAFYLGLLSVTVGVVEWTALEGTTLLVVAEEFMGPAALAFFVVGGAFVAAVTTMNVTFTLVSRGLLVVAGDRLLPAALGRVHPRFGTPHVALTVCVVLAGGSLLLGLSGRFLGVLMNLGLVLGIAVVCLAAAQLPTRHPEIFAAGAGRLRPGTLRAVSRTVVALNALVGLMLAAALPAAAATLAAVLAVAAVGYHLRCRALGRAVDATPAPSRQPG